MTLTIEITICHSADRTLVLFPLLHDMFSTRLGGVKETHGCVIAACEELSRKSTNDDVVNGFGVD